MSDFCHIIAQLVWPGSIAQQSTVCCSYWETKPEPVFQVYTRRRFFYNSHFGLLSILCLFILRNQARVSEVTFTRCTQGQSNQEIFIDLWDRENCIVRIFLCNLSCWATYSRRRKYLICPKAWTWQCDSHCDVKFHGNLQQLRRWIELIWG